MSLATDGRRGGVLVRLLDVVELLMLEHASLRLQFQFARKSANWDAIYEIEEFVRNCHARVEDEIVFPRLKEIAKDKESVLKDLSRLEADHRLIERIGDQIKQRTVDEKSDLETLRKRILLFATTVESHNASEEELIFPHWDEKRMSNEQVKESVLRVIRGFGLNRYFQLTGISEKLLGSL